MKEWTIMIYMAGDNNLTEDMVAALKAIKKFANNHFINIVALYDSNYPPVPVKVYDFTLKPSAQGDLDGFENPEAVDQITGRPAPSPENTFFNVTREFVPLKKFVPWVLRQEKFKAQKYALILSGHSDGIIGRTILRDENPPNVLNLKQLAKILKKCRQFLPIETHPEQKFDLLGFDGCLMAMLESAYEMKKVAKVMVASEGNIPNIGWDYESVFDCLFQQHGKLTACDFAKDIVKKYADFSQDFIPSGRMVNISAFDLTMVDCFVNHFNAIAEFLLRIINLNIRLSDSFREEEAFINAYKKERFKAFIIKSHYYSQTFMHEQGVDILDFICQIYNELLQFEFELNQFIFQNKTSETATDSEQETSINFLDSEFKLLQNEQKKLQTAYGDFVLKSCFSGADYQFSKGVSVFFPWSEMALNLVSFQYRRLKFTKKKPNWFKFVKAFINLTRRTPETKNLSYYLISKGIDPSPENIDIVTYLQYILDLEEGGREYVGREYVGRGNFDSFYTYFSQIRNYPHFKRMENPPRDCPIKGCNDGTCCNQRTDCDTD